MGSGNKLLTEAMEGSLELRRAKTDRMCLGKGEEKRQVAQRRSMPWLKEEVGNEREIERESAG